MNIKSVLYDALISKMPHKDEIVLKSSIVDAKTVKRGKCPQEMLDELSNGRGDD